MWLGRGKGRSGPPEATKPRKRQIDKEATKRARTTHARGVQMIRALIGADPEAAADLIADRRRTNGVTGRGPTQKQTTRPERRTAGKAQRAARRGKTLQGRTNAKRRHQRARGKART